LVFLRTKERKEEAEEKGKGGEKTQIILFLFDTYLQIGGKNDNYIILSAFGKRVLGNGG
jgi:hypothetical protein